MDKMRIEKFTWFMLFMLLFQNCEKSGQLGNEDIIEVDFSKINQDTTRLASSSNNNTLNIAISAMVSPIETYRFYEELINYISKKSNRAIRFVQRESYKEVNKLLEMRQVDLAFICSGAYVQAIDKMPINIIAIPVIKGNYFYRAYIIVHKNSQIQKFTDLKGKIFAFTDPLSNTGYLYALKRVKELNSSADQFFSRTIFTYAHDYSIQAVDRKIVEGATVDGLIFDYLKHFNPERVENLKVIETSEAFGMPPVVTLNPDIKKHIQPMLLEMHKDAQGKKILKKLMIDRFVSSDSTDYGSILENLKFVGS
jgi:phosphonate transport system substrate-binding protein